MANTHLEGRTVRLKHSPQVVYSLFSDLSNFTRNLPQEMRDKAEITASADTLVGKVQGFELGIHVSERIPFNRIRYEQYGASPFTFEIDVSLTDMGDGSTEFQLFFDSEIPGMIKMMLGNKLQEAIDKITDQIQAAF